MGVSASHQKRSDNELWRTEIRSCRSYRLPSQQRLPPYSACILAPRSSTYRILTRLYRSALEVCTSHCEGQPVGTRNRAQREQ